MNDEIKRVRPKLSKLREASQKLKEEAAAADKCAHSCFYSRFGSSGGSVT